MTGALSPSHWLLIVLVIALLFGAKRLPAAARGLGQSMRIFKAETSALTEERSEEKQAAAVEATATPAATPVATPVAARAGEPAA